MPPCATTAGWRCDERAAGGPPWALAPPQPLQRPAYSQQQAPRMTVLVVDDQAVNRAVLAAQVRRFPSVRFRCMQSPAARFAPARARRAPRPAGGRIRGGGSGAVAPARRGGRRGARGAVVAMDCGRLLKSALLSGAPAGRPAAPRAPAAGTAAGRRSPRPRFSGGGGARGLSGAAAGPRAWAAPTRRAAAAAPSRPPRMEPRPKHPPPLAAPSRPT